MFAAVEQLIFDRRYGDAIALCLRELAASPRCVTLRLLLARALLARHQRKDAAAQLRECLLIDPSCVEAQAALADIAEQEQRAAAAVAGQPVNPAAAVTSFSALSASASAKGRPRPTPSAVIVSDVPMPPKPLVAPKPLQAPQRTSSSSSPAVAVRADADEAAPLLVPAQSRLSARISATHAAIVTGPLPVIDSFPPSPLYDADEGRTIVSAPPPQMPLGSAPSLLAPIPQPMAPLPTPLQPTIVRPAGQLFAPAAPVRLSSLYGGDQAPTNVATRKPRLEQPQTAQMQKLPPLKPQIVRTRRRSAFAREAVVTPTAPVEMPFASRRKPLPGAAWILVGLVASIPLWNRDRGTTALPPAALMTATTMPASKAPVTTAPDAAALERAQLAELMRDIWVHPLPGPARRMPIRDSRVFGAERVGDRPSECVNGHCGVDIGSAYGEAVFAVHDGVIDRVQRGANADHGGHYVRIMHRGRTIVSQYFHLAAIPPQLDVGQTVKAGDIVGWVGRSGIKHSAPHLHFTIAVQEPNGDHARYIDPEPLIALWPLRVSAAGGDPLRLTAEVAPGTPRGGAHHHHHATVASAPTASATTDQE